MGEYLAVRINCQWFVNKKPCLFVELAQKKIEPEAAGTETHRNNGNATPMRF